MVPDQNAERTSSDARTFELREQLLGWYEGAETTYPWREASDPYAILLAEFMLHRTGADQVEPIYRKFMKLYPDLKSFSEGNRQEMREILSSLGLNWRIDAMLKALEQIANDHDHVPPDYEYLQSIDGIGPYIAGATVCFSENEPVSLVDTNTVRVTGRVFGLNLEGEARRRKEVIETIGSAVDPDNPRAYYFAMIDLAHEICHPNNPECADCPLATIPCEYARSHQRGPFNDPNN